MTHTELKHQIQDIIRDITHREFINPIIIHDLQPQGYAVGLEIRQYDPVWYSAELPDEEFLKFIKRELRQAKFLKKGFYRAIRNTTLDHPLNGLVSPYDTAGINGKNR